MSKSEKTLMSDRAKAVGVFIADLAAEGERSAVVLGASRADTALDELLKRAMRPHPGGSDNLFDPDRPIGTFSAKIALAYRLGLIDQSCEHALQMLRRIRNAFAHSTGRATLSESQHRSRVLELVNEARKNHDFYDSLHSSLNKITSTDLRAFCAATGVVISSLDFAATKVEQLKPSHVSEIRSAKKA